RMPSFYRVRARFRKLCGNYAQILLEPTSSVCCLLKGERNTTVRKKASSSANQRRHRESRLQSPAPTCFADSVAGNAGRAKRFFGKTSDYPVRNAREFRVRPSLAR